MYYVYIGVVKRHSGYFPIILLNLLSDPLQYQHLAVLWHLCRWKVFYSVNEIIIEQGARDIWYSVSMRHLNISPTARINVDKVHVTQQGILHLAGHVPF